MIFIKKEQEVKDDNFNITLFKENEIIENINNDILFKAIENIYNIDDIIFKRYYSIDFKKYTLTSIKINLIDPNMKAEYDSEPKENKISDRTFINLVSKIKINHNEQIELINKFNNELRKFRSETYSLTLSSYREFSRKRLTINEALILMSWCYSHFI
jgi:hypothetical protein